jgi:phage baseplate assembly protein W
MPFQDKPIQNFIGSGLTFPIELNNGRGVIKTGFDLIRSSIRAIVMWPEGQRFYLAEFGSKLERLIEEPNDDVLKQIIYTFIVDPINQWEKRISLTQAEIVSVDDRSINISLTYRILNSQSEDSFIFPFYRKITY